MRLPLSITALSSVSALGASQNEVWNSYQANQSLFSRSEQGHWVCALPDAMEAKLDQLRASHPNYQHLDRSVLLALLAAYGLSGISIPPVTGVHLGSSRGATHVMERDYGQFLENGEVSLLTSPTTTLGNISSWVAQQLQVAGPSWSHSVTCSTAMHAALNAIAWIQADMADAFLVGGSEAPLTPFTIAQMRALKLYADQENPWACESLKMDKKRNTMVLGEAAGIMLVERGISEKTLAVIAGYGYASEHLSHPVSISEQGVGLQQSMQMALGQAGLETVDAVVMHAPGTVKGDEAEIQAVATVFRNKIPLLTTNKYLVGHTLGASGIMSIEMAIQMLTHNQFIQNPFYTPTQAMPSSLESVMINAIGFGGNAVSLILTK